MADWFLGRQEICKACTFNGCYLKRLKGKCRDMRLALPLFCCPHEFWLPVKISKIKVSKTTLNARQSKCAHCNYNSDGYCQAIRGCGASPIRSESTKISEFIEYEEMLPYRGCKHPRRNQRVRPHNGWLK